MFTAQGPCRSPLALRRELRFTAGATQHSGRHCRMQHSTPLVAAPLNWTRLASRPSIWHASPCIAAEVVERLLALSNATVDPMTDPGIPSGAAIVHSILDQADPAVQIVRRTMASRAGMPHWHAQSLLPVSGVWGTTNHINIHFFW